jgi:hypothetical protein
MGRKWAKFPIQMEMLTFPMILYKYFLEGKNFLTSDVSCLIGLWYRIRSDPEPSTDPIMLTSKSVHFIESFL